MKEVFVAEEKREVSKELGYHGLVCSEILILDTGANIKCEPLGCQWCIWGSSQIPVGATRDHDARRHRR